MKKENKQTPFLKGVIIGGLITVLGFLFFLRNFVISSFGTFFMSILLVLILLSLFFGIVNHLYSKIKNKLNSLPFVVRVIIKTIILDVLLIFVFVILTKGTSYILDGGKINCSYFEAVRPCSLLEYLVQNPLENILLYLLLTSIILPPISFLIILIYEIIKLKFSRKEKSRYVKK